MSLLLLRMSRAERCWIFVKVCHSSHHSHKLNTCLRKKWDMGKQSLVAQSAITMVGYQEGQKNGWGTLTAQ